MSSPTRTLQLCSVIRTTSRPKGVISTLRGSYLAAVGNAFEAQVLPMFHGAGWTFPWANVFACATQSRLELSTTPRHDPVPHPMSTVVAGSAPTAQLIGQLEQIGIKPIHVYGLTETLGPFTRCYDQPFWKTLTLAERAKLMARQGQSFATAQNVRVVYPPKHENDQDLIDVPKDGKTVGEIVTRGNIVMKEYFRDPEATRKAFRGGYFNSGDIAVMHPNG
ncbi:hypothetical protein BU15DRAFT_69311, partial [Melanogaster broomeanus]